MITDRGHGFGQRVVRMVTDLERGGEITAIARVYGVKVEFVCSEWRTHDKT